MSIAQLVRRAAATTAVLACGAAGHAQTATPAAAAPATVDRLLVLNKSAGTATILDATARKVLATVTVGTGPHEVAVAPDGRTAVVCNYGDQRPGNSLTVIDVPTATATATFELMNELPAPAPANGESPTAAARPRTFLRPHGIRYLADGRHVVITSEQTRRLLVVDVPARKVVRALPSPQPQLHMVALAGDGKRAFGASLADGTMSIFDLGGAQDAVATTVATGAGAEGIAVRPGSAEVWVANREADTLSVVDPDARKVLAELETGALPIRVECTPDGTRALVSCADAGTVEVFDCARRQRVHTVDLLADKTEQSPVPIGICIAPDGDVAWIACARGEWLAVVDLRTYAVIDRVPAGPGPDGMAFARWRTDK